MTDPYPTTPKNRTMIPQYSVTADPKTGEWLTTPQFVKMINHGWWVRKADTPMKIKQTYRFINGRSIPYTRSFYNHFYEGPNVPLTVKNVETRAIEIQWMGEPTRASLRLTNNTFAPLWIDAAEESIRKFLIERGQER